MQSQPNPWKILHYQPNNQMFRITGFENLTIWINMIRTSLEAFYLRRINESSQMFTNLAWVLSTNISNIWQDEISNTSLEKFLNAKSECQQELNKRYQLAGGSGNGQTASDRPEPTVTSFGGHYSKLFIILYLILEFNYSHLAEMGLLPWYFTIPQKISLVVYMIKYKWKKNRNCSPQSMQILSYPQHSACKIFFKEFIHYTSL